MTLQPGLMLACMLGIGFLAQWLAWRVKLPAILFLLLAGIVLGPVTGAFQATFSVALHFTGRPLSVVVPVPLGPRH